MNCPYCLKEMKKGGVKVIDTSNNMYSSVLWYPVSTKPKITGYNELLRLVRYNRQGEGYNETEKPKKYAKFHYI